ncbi:MAG: phasin family protein [Armatimonadetes bacterium]|nr:phasin family protein [Armatimonadota bacterium]
MLHRNMGGPIGSAPHGHTHPDQRIRTMNDKIAAANKIMEDAVAQAKENMDGFIKASQEQAGKASAQMMKGYDELTTIAKQNVEAFIQSGTIVAKGAEEAGKQVAAFTQSSLEKGMATGKAMMGVKTFRDLVDLQNEYTKSSFDALVAETTRMQELSLKIANEAFAPINARVNATIEKIAKPIAA